MLAFLELTPRFKKRKMIEKRRDIWKICKWRMENPGAVYKR